MTWKFAYQLGCGEGGGGATDPFFDQVTLLLHYNGTNGSTVFPDSSSLAHPMTPVGNTQVDTAVQKYGGASGLFDGTGDYISTPYVQNDFGMAGTDYTVEAWVRANGSWAGWSDDVRPSLIGD